MNIPRRMLLMASEKHEVIDLIPDMTSNTTPYGVGSQSASWAGTLAWQALGRNNRLWNSIHTNEPRWIKYTFASPVHLTAVSVTDFIWTTYYSGKFAIYADYGLPTERVLHEFTPDNTDEYIATLENINVDNVTNIAIVTTERIAAYFQLAYTWATGWYEQEVAL